jgi:hypothetical protein
MNRSPSGVPARGCGSHGNRLCQRGEWYLNGVQVPQLAEVDGEPLIAMLVSYRDPVLAIRCGLPPFFP